MVKAAAKIEKQEYTRNKLVSTLLGIGHGDLSHYTEQCLPAAKADPALFGHFLAWARKNNKVRDGRVAMPVIALRGLTSSDKALAENAVAHLLTLSPRELVQAYDFNYKMTGAVAINRIDGEEIPVRSHMEKDELDLFKGEPYWANPIKDTAHFAIKIKGQPIPGGHRKLLEEGIRLYLSLREQSPKWFDRTALQHRRALKRLYRLSRAKISPYAKAVLFDDGEIPKSSVFAKVRALRTMSAKEAAGTIIRYEIPFDVAIGSVAKAKDRDIVLGILENISGNQLITNTKALLRWGINSDPVLKAAYDAALVRARGDKRTGTLKAGVAAETLGAAHGDIKEKLQSLQREKTAQLGSIDGNWLVAGDKSSSMSESVELARKTAALIAERVSGRVHLVYFDTSPTYFEVTGKSYAEILELTRMVRAYGNTGIGCSLDYLRSRSTSVDGIAIVSDGGENTAPYFSAVYKRYCEQLGVEPTVYLLHVSGDSDALSKNCKKDGVALEKLELEQKSGGKSKVDYYSLPNIVGLLRTNRYSLYDEIMEIPLLTFQDIRDQSAKTGKGKHIAL